MDNQTIHQLTELNRSIIQFRGLYSSWSSKHNISYNEMLVLYTIHEKSFCTQKQICDSYLLPRQTINHVIAQLRNEGILEISREHSVGREKAFVLTEKGKCYAQPLMEAMDRFESRSIELLGHDKLEMLTTLMLEYGQALSQALQEE